MTPQVELRRCHTGEQDKSLFLFFAGGSGMLVWLGAPALVHGCPSLVCVSAGCSSSAAAAGDHDSDPGPEASQRSPSLRFSLSAVSATCAHARTHALRRALLSEAEVLGSDWPPSVPGGR